jgi:hypothetical protein
MARLRDRNRASSPHSRRAAFAALARHMSALHESLGLAFGVRPAGAAQRRFRDRPAAARTRAASPEPATGQPVAATPARDRPLVALPAARNAATKHPSVRIGYRIRRTGAGRNARAMQPSDAPPCRCAAARVRYRGHLTHRPAVALPRACDTVATGGANQACPAALRLRRHVDGCRVIHGRGRCTVWSWVVRFGEGLHSRRLQQTTGGENRIERPALPRGGEPVPHG